MAKIEGVSKEVLDKAEWVAIATTGEDGPHVVATWGDYVRALYQDDDVIVVPAGKYHKTEANLTKDKRVEVLMGTRQVQGGGGPGQGFSATGVGEMQTSGEYAEAAKAQFPWARGALVIIVSEVEVQL